MATNCKKCGMLKLTENSRCNCNAKKFDESKLVRKKDGVQQNKTPKPIPQISEKKKERIATGGSEINLFKSIFKKKVKDKQNFCIICKEKLIESNEDIEGNVTTACFPHILPKGKYPEFRLLESNLQYLVCGIEHHKKYDEIINEVKKDIGLVELEKIIANGKKLDLSKYLDY